MPLFKKKDKTKKYSKKIYSSVRRNDTKSFKKLLNEINASGTLIDFNDSDVNYQNTPLMEAISNHNAAMVESLMEYIDEHNMLLGINEPAENGNTPLLYALKLGNTKEMKKIVKLLLNYATKNEISLNLNDEINREIPLLLFSRENNREIIDLVIGYADEQQTVLGINDNDYGSSPLIESTDIDSIDYVKIIIDYANRHEIILDINDKDDNKNYPLLFASKNNNIEMVQLLMEYADTHNIILIMNDKSEKKRFPILEAIENNNVEMVKLLIDYAIRHQITLNIRPENIKPESVNKDILDLLTAYNNQKVIN